MKKVTTKFELNSTDLSTQIRPSFFFQNFSSLIAFRTMRFSIHFCFMWKKYFKKILSFLLEFCWLIWNFLQIVHSTFPQVAQFKILIVLNLFFVHETRRSLVWMYYEKVFFVCTTISKMLRKFTISNWLYEKKYLL